MAVCNYCNREMLDGKGCKPFPVMMGGKSHRRIKVGAEGDWFQDEDYARCGDCGAETGYYHHAGCDCERCPICGHQLISCDCVFDGEEPV